jgi:hypothetical protein
MPAGPFSVERLHGGCNGEPNLAIENRPANRLVLGPRMAVTCCVRAAERLARRRDVGKHRAIISTRRLREFTAVRTYM